MSFKRSLTGIITRSKTVLTRESLCKRPSFATGFKNRGDTQNGVPKPVLNWFWNGNLLLGQRSRTRSCDLIKGQILRKEREREREQKQIGAQPAKGRKTHVSRSRLQ